MIQVRAQMSAVDATLDITKDIADRLNEASVPLSSIDSIIWSHHHVDHIGDPSLFPKTTSLIVGPTFKSNPQTFPGYPLNPNALVTQDAFDGREVIELDFEAKSLEVGGYKAIDLFDDGSFYLLQASGHTHDHICALARTSEDKFIFMGGDAAHHNAQFRPTPHLPLPDTITPSPFEPPTSHSFCPGSIFEAIHPEAASGEGAYKITPFYKLNPVTNASLPEAETTLARMQLLDASPDVLVIIAHDASLLDLLDFHPAELNGWEKTKNKSLGRWRFLVDFKDALELARKERNDPETCIPCKSCCLPGNTSGGAVQ